MKIFTWILVLWGCSSGVLVGQQTHSAVRRSATAGSLSGRAFGVTQNGDLKPAILADVYLFYEFSIRPDGKVADMNESDTTATVYMSNLNRENEANLEKMKQQNTSERLECLRDLLAYDSAIVKTLQGVTKDKSWQVISGQTDENGYFTLKVPHQGAYILVVKGQAGANNAVWQQNEVRIFTGKPTEVKLGTAAQSCLKSDDD